MNQEQIVKELITMLEGLIKGEKNWLANFSNATALIYHHLQDINWAGFYILRGEQLVLGPFQGKPACVRINIGHGVCGHAVQDEKTFLVEDVHQFPGHIACDPASRSELVVPLKKDNKVFGVLDLDSPLKARFTEMEKGYLEKYVDILLKNTDIDLEKM